MRHFRLNQTFILLAALLVLAGCSGGSRRHSGTNASEDQAATAAVETGDSKTISQPKPEAQPSATDTQPAPDPEPAVADPEPAAQDPEPAVEDPAPAVEDPEPAVEDPEPAPVAQPTVALSVDNDLINAGGGVTLLWDSTNADACEASGGWSGDKATSGQQVFNGIQSNQTYSLTCTGAGGNAVSMVSVAVLGSLEISWQAPTENIDGTPVDVLSAFRIHYGANSGQYDSVVEVDGNVSSHTLDVVVGEYFIAMTAVDVEGDESALSNEVVKNAI